jgi:hypothetical protein
MAKKTIDTAALGQTINTTWGNSSTPKTASYSVKLQLTGESNLLATYACVVSFGSDAHMVEIVRSHRTESDVVLAEVIKRIKTNYKDLTGDSISLKMDKESSHDSFEVINVNPHNLRRSGCFRRKVVLEVS